jgi:hypothetical protein
MPRRSGVFHLMEIATKQMAFSLRYVTRKRVVDLQLIWGKKRLFLIVWGEGSWNEKKKKVVSNPSRMEGIECSSLVPCNSTFPISTMKIQQDGLTRLINWLLSRNGW